MRDPYHPTTESLTEAECWRLFDTQPYGRVAAHMAGRLELFPVNVVAIDQTIYIRTAPGTLLSTISAASEVLVEVDGTEDRNGISCAWSVVVRGYAELVDSISQEIELETSGPHPWQAGVKDDFVKIAASEVTGRIFPRLSGGEED